MAIGNIFTSKNGKIKCDEIMLPKDIEIISKNKTLLTIISKKIKIKILFKIKIRKKARYKQKTKNLIN
jgi:hypothetical protein